MRFGRRGLVGLACFLVALWCCLGGYRGLDHDAVYYAFLAERVLHPEVFRNDLFVMYGSQGQFTLFPAGFAALVRLMGLMQAAFVLAAAGQILWWAAALCLARQLAPKAAWVLGLAALVVHSPYYDGITVFAYCEHFATPRIFAEALCMLSFAMMLARRYWLSLALAGFAMLLHPLMALFVLVVVLWCGVQAAEGWRTRLYVLIGLGCAGVGGLAFAHVAPFSALLQVFDPAWLAIVEMRNANVFLAGLGWQPLVHAVYLMLVLWLLRPWLPAALARAVPVLLLAGTGFLLAWWLGSSVVPDVLLTQLQLWRCIWFLQILALLALGGALPAMWRGQLAHRWLGAFLLAGACLESWVALPLAGCGVLVGYLIQQRPAIAASAIGRYAPVGLLILPVLSKASLWQDLFFMGFAVVPMPLLYVCVALCAALVASLVWVSAGRGEACANSALLIIGLCSVLAGAGVWSAPYWAQRIPARPDDGSLAALRARIPPAAVVGGEQGMMWTWFSLGRSHYVSHGQLVGALFSRQTALEGFRRMGRAREAGLADNSMAFGGLDALEPRKGLLAADRIHWLCEDPVLDFLILRGSYAGAEWFGPAQSRLSLFDCQRLRPGA